MDRAAEMARGAEVVLGSPAALYQFLLSPAGVSGLSFVSAAFAERYEFEVGEPEETAARFFSRVHPADLEHMKGEIAHSARTLETFECAFRFRLASEEEVWMQARSNPQRMPDGGVLWNGILTDVTAQKKAEAALRESEERYRNLFYANPHPMWFYDTETLAFLEVNDAAVAHYGFQRDEFLAMTIADIRPTEDVPLLRDAVRQVREGRIDDAGIWRHRKKDGSIISVEITSHVLEYHGRRAEIVLAHDITARLSAEKAHRDSEESVVRLNAELEEALAWQRHIFEGSRDAIFVSDEEGRFVAVNRAATELTGYSREELLTMTIPDLHEEPDLVAFRAFHQRIIAGENILSNAPVRKKDGSKVAVEFNNTVVVVGQSRFMHTAGRDVTERVHLEHRLHQSQKMEAIGLLAGGVAHDFNNALTVISGNAEIVLADVPPEDPKRGPMMDIRNASERAASLTQQLLAFGRKQMLQPVLVDAHDVLSRVQRMVGRLIGEDIEIRTAFAANPSWVRVDPGQFEQVVINFALNARDAMPTGGRITIRTRNVEAAEPLNAELTAGLRLRPKIGISVTDTGTGMTSEVRARIFEPFFTTKEFGRGSGLGLATTFGFVKQSGGDITVESEPGKGSTFTIVLPAEFAPRSPGGSSARSRTLPHGTEAVLLVEDEDAVRRIVKVTLESAGYRVTEAPNAAEALDTARRSGAKIDLVITDVVMPVMSGRELAERLAKDHPGLRILYMSGYTDDAVTRHGVGSGVSFLQKPFTPLALACKVREVLDAKVG